MTPPTRHLWSELTTPERNAVFAELCAIAETTLAKQGTPMPISWKNEILKLAAKRTWWRHADGKVRGTR